jgi:predicted dinucleotide-binding enzyme
MKIGVLGSGDVGQALAKGFIQLGHQVMIGTNSPAKAGELKSKMPSLTVGAFDQTAKFGDWVVLAVKGTAAESAVLMAGVDHLKRKIVIDATNPIADTPPTQGVLKFFTNLDESLMERLQRKIPEALFVKAFNSIGSGLMFKPNFGKQKPTMFICGNDAAARQNVGRMVEEFGFEVEDMGAAEAARAIEPLCILWCIPGFLRHDWTHAFKLLKK